MNRSDWQTLADIRIAEAQTLLAAGQPDGAYYLAGYSVECALKAAICKLTGAHDWPEKSFVNDCHTHEILKLVRLAGLDAARTADSAGNPALKDNWSIVEDWSERSRYGRHSLVEAQKLIEAVIDNANGVLPWIKARW